MNKAIWYTINDILALPPSFNMTIDTIMLLTVVGGSFVTPTTNGTMAIQKLKNNSVIQTSVMDNWSSGVSSIPTCHIYSFGCSVQDNAVDCGMTTFKFERKSLVNCGCRNQEVNRTAYRYRVSLPESVTRQVFWHIFVFYDCLPLLSLLYFNP